MLQNSGSVTTRINPPRSPAERERRYQQVLRELRDPKFYQNRITGMLLNRGYLWPNERDDVNALRQAVILFISDTLRKTPKPNRKAEDKEIVRRNLNLRSAGSRLPRNEREADYLLAPLSSQSTWDRGRAGVYS